MTAPTKTVFKVFLSFKKEEEWLESMSAQGWHLMKTPGLVYVFSKGEPETRIYKIDFRTIRKQEDMEEYLAFFEESNWFCVEPKTGKYNYYFYTTTDNEVKDIFSDQLSQAQHLRRYANVLVQSLVIPTLPLFIIFMTRTVKISEMGYLTPGLWEMKGLQFVWHFLFETPFVIMRVGGGLLPLWMILAALVFYIKSTRDYRKAQQN